MTIKPIKTQRDYRKALKEIEKKYSGQTPTVIDRQNVNAASAADCA